MKETIKHTTIRISQKTWRHIRASQKVGETQDQALQRLLKIDRLDRLDTSPGSNVNINEALTEVTELTEGN